MLKLFEGTNPSVSPCTGNVCRQHLDGETSLEEIRFVLFGEPAYRLFEMVNDAARVQAQAERLKNR